MSIIFLFFSFIYCSDVYYKLNVDIDPKNNFISVSGNIKFKNSYSDLNFYLDKNLIISKTNVNVSFDKFSNNYVWYKIYSKNKNLKSFNISYSGILNYPIEGSDNYAKGIKNTRGIISENGCFISEISGWYPIFENMRSYFDIKVKIPIDYDVVLPGKLRSKKEIGNFKEINYITSKPVFEIALVCGRYKSYYLDYKTPIYVYMLNPDEELAMKYLNYSKLYIEMYEKMIGKYPYEKFAVVENFWETGYAFPSFTLLGSSVMKLPFIFVNSLPHEILHNWFGNGVYVDYKYGNWSEGLTTYLSDYLMAEQRGKDVDYRMNILKKYKDYVSDDIPLNKFYERHSNQTEAIGYAKSMMFFHMIRKMIGDENFLKGLQIFYLKNLYKKASWNDINNAFKEVIKINLDDFFDTFVNNQYSFSPAILKENTLINDKNVQLTILNNGFSRGKVPIQFFYGDNDFDEYFVFISSGVNKYDFKIRDKLAAICLDCSFDVLRYLADDETPVTFSKVFAKEKVRVVINKKNTEDLNKIYELVDNDGDIFVGDSYIGLIEENEFVKISEENIIIDGKSYKIEKYNFAFVLPYNKKNSFKAFFICRDKCEIALNKLFHYGKYSYLIFDKDLNVIDSGIWNIKDRDNLILFNKSFYLSKRKTKPLISYHSNFIEKNIKKDVYYLSSKLKTRHPGSFELLKASYYIENRFKKLKLKPFFANSYRQSFSTNINKVNYELHNICGKTSDEKSYIIVSAHYDHIFPDERGMYPGANDNASGVGVLMELARVFRLQNEKGIVFCAFSGEEYGREGSKFFLKNLGNIKITANINLDTVGRLDSNIIVLNYHSSPFWKSILRKASLASGISYELGLNAIFPGDHLSFIEKFIPAIHVYDGNMDDYHKTTDVFNKINFEKMLWVCDFVYEIVKETKKTEELIFVGTDIVKNYDRKFSLGFAPDFSYKGSGVKIKKLNENSILKRYGFKDGDIIVGINGYKIENIFDYMAIISNLNLIDEISLKCICSGIEGEVRFSVKNQ